MLLNNCCSFDLHTVVKKIHQHQPIILVTIVAHQGSVPRETGTRMWVTAEAFGGTIGGGNLEWIVLNEARNYLNNSDKPRTIQRIALGTHLGQCCGGVVYIGYEYLCTYDLIWLNDLLKAEALMQPIQRHVLMNENTVNIYTHQNLFKEVGLNEKGWVEDVQVNLMPVYLFGAGHVAQALVRLLADLPCQVYWVDSRPYSFDKKYTHIHFIQTADPLSLISQAKAGAYYLVMTHQHELDFALIAAILARNDSAYCGLIGSKTKKHRFIHRLIQQGIDEVTCQQMTCPIGIAGLTHKSPAYIAVAVVAQLLQQYESVSQPITMPQPTLMRNITKNIDKHLMTLKTEGVIEKQTACQTCQVQNCDASIKDPFSPKSITAL